MQITRREWLRPSAGGYPQVMSSYDPQGEVNLHGFTGSMAVYTVATAALIAVGRGAGERLPERFEVLDLVAGGVATHKFARLLGKGAITSPVRAPFTQFEEAAGSSEHVETPRDDSTVRHTIGELLTCPFCLGVWIGTAYVATLAVSPRSARVWAALGTVTAVSDFLQHGYARVRTD